MYCKLDSQNTNGAMNLNRSVGSSKENTGLYYYYSKMESFGNSMIRNVAARDLHTNILREYSNEKKKRKRNFEGS
jgi:hypothetical protein